MGPIIDRLLCVRSAKIAFVWFEKITRCRREDDRCKYPRTKRKKMQKITSTLPILIPSSGRSRVYIFTSPIGCLALTPKKTRLLISCTHRTPKQALRSTHDSLRPYRPESLRVNTPALLPNITRDCNAKTGGKRLLHQGVWEVTRHRSRRDVWHPWRALHGWEWGMQFPFFDSGGCVDRMVVQDVCVCGEDRSRSVFRARGCRGLMTGRLDMIVLVSGALLVLFGEIEAGGREETVRTLCSCCCC